MNNPHKGTTGVRRIWNALFYSFAGLAAAFRHESAFRQEVLLALVLLPVALLLDVTPAAKALLAGSVMLVLIVELVNSAIEAVVDRISLEKHDLSGRAKDIGSAAVFLSLVTLVMVWALVLLDT
jgi:diacylglycerol kinase (ATP)